MNLPFHFTGNAAYEGPHGWSIQNLVNIISEAGSLLDELQSNFLEQEYEMGKICAEVPIFRKFPEIGKFQIERSNFRKKNCISR